MLVFDRADLAAPEAGDGMNRIISASSGVAAVWMTSTSHGSASRSRGSSVLRSPPAPGCIRSARSRARTRRLPRECRVLVGLRRRFGVRRICTMCMRRRTSPPRRPRRRSARSARAEPSSHLPSWRRYSLRVFSVRRGWLVRGSIAIELLLPIALDEGSDGSFSAALAERIEPHPRLRISAGSEPSGTRSSAPCSPGSALSRARRLPVVAAVV